jgi:hypothetical protein
LKTYNCICGQLIFFQNFACMNCGRELGFLPDSLQMSSLDPETDALWRPTVESARGSLYKKCANYAKENVCNWMVPSAGADSFCVSCRLNEMIPDLGLAPNRDLWAITEGAKRRLVYSLLHFHLPVSSKKDDPQRGLAFRFLSDTTNSDGTVTRAMTGHENGTITINISEADDAGREKLRRELREPYRTLLGDFRHESGHYYWDRLVLNTQFLEPYRALFGDERADYGEALKRHYSTGAPGNWQDSFISAYATSHPWEDWAETWAHFLHIDDTLEVAHDFGLVGKHLITEAEKKRRESQAPPPPNSYEATVKAWCDLAVPLNSINRSMGLPDLYPFVLSQPVMAKLKFISEVVAGTTHAAAV